MRLEVRGDPSDLATERSAVGHRVVQEALTNVLRHAPGSAIRIGLDCREGLALTVENGPSAALGSSTLGAGRGLEGLRERVTALGGSTAWGPTASGGWRLAVTLR